jgi:hypothetical protein
MPVIAIIDWSALLDDLAHLYGERGVNGALHRPCPTERLARHLGVPRGTLRGWQQGQEPKHGDGEMLLERWCTLTSKTRAHAPMTRRRPR